MSAKALPGFRDFYPQEFAERAYMADQHWREAAHAAEQLALLAPDAKARAGHLARVSACMRRENEGGGWLQSLERASELDPSAHLCGYHGILSIQS